MAFWNPIDWGTELVKEGASRVTGNEYDMRNPASSVYGEQKTNSLGGRGLTDSERASIPGTTLIGIGDIGSSGSNGGVLGANTGGGGAYGGQNPDPQTVALYDQGIAQAQAAMARLNNQQSIGLQNVNNSFQSALQKLLSGKAMAERDYSTNKDQSTQDNIKARSSIDFSTGRQANALQRLLGSKGAGSSSAARIAAPYAAALQGTQQQQQVGDAFGRNMQALDTSWGDYQTNWDSSREDLDTQKYQGENSLKADVAGKRQNLLQTLASLSAQRQEALGGGAGASVAAAQPYLNQVNSLGTEIDNLGRQYPGNISAKGVDYKSPELSQYQYSPTATPQLGNTSAMTDTINPYLSLLLKGKKTESASY